MVNALIPLDTLGADIRARLDAGDKAVGRAEDHYLAAGLQLVEARRRVESGGGSFREFLAQHGIGKSRAYEVIAVAEGTKTFAGIRAKTAERVAQHAKRGREAMASVSSGQIVEAEPPAPVEDGELERLRAENARLREELEKAKAAAAEQEEMASLRLGRAQQAEQQRDEAQTRALFAEADKDRLAAELVAAQEEIARLTAPVPTAIDLDADQDGVQRRQEFWDAVAEMDEDRRRAVFAQRTSEAQARDRDASERAATFLARHLAGTNLKDAADVIAPLAPGIAEAIAAIGDATRAVAPAPAPLPKKWSRAPSKPKPAPKVAPSVAAMFGGNIKPAPSDDDLANFNPAVAYPWANPMRSRPTA